MTKLYISFFYFLYFAVFYLNSWSVFSLQLPSPQYIWLLSWIPSTHNYKIVGTALYLSSFVILLIAIRFNGKFIRASACVILLLFYSFLYSFGKISHSDHVWLFASLFIIFMRDKENMNSERNLLMIRLMQSQVLFQYFSSGLWKLRNIYDVNSYVDLENRVLDQLAYSIAEGNGPFILFRTIFIEQYPEVYIWGFILVVLFQLSTLIPIFLGRFHFYFGYLAVGFHACTGFSLGIWYWGTALGALFFLTFTELILMAPNIVKKVE